MSNKSQKKTAKKFGKILAALSIAKNLSELAPALPGSTGEIRFTRYEIPNYLEGIAFCQAYLEKEESTFATLST